MTKALPNNDKDLVNAHLYIELQKKGLGHQEILAKIIESNEASQTMFLLLKQTKMSSLKTNIQTNFKDMTLTSYKKT